MDPNQGPGRHVTVPRGGCASCGIGGAGPLSRARLALALAVGCGWRDGDCAADETGPDPDATHGIIERCHTPSPWRAGWTRSRSTAREHW